MVGDIVGKDYKNFQAISVDLVDSDGGIVKIKTDFKGGYIPKQIPVGQYEIKRIFVGEFKDRLKDHFALYCSDSIIIEKGKSNIITLGKPKIKLNLFKNTNKLPEIKQGETVNIKDDILISASITGIAGESYSLFYTPNSSLNPKLKIIDSSGKVVFFRNLNIYNIRDIRKRAALYFDFSVPGKYTIIASVDTGDFMGVIEDRFEIIIYDKRQLYIKAAIYGTIFGVVLIPLIMIIKNKVEKIDRISDS